MRGSYREQPRTDRHYIGVFCLLVIILCLQEFNPERFHGDQWDKRDPYSFVPFSAGPRNCIGQNFAMNEEKVFIARMVHRFILKLDTKSKAERFPSGVMRAKNGIRLYLEPRS